jgi:hypothetical protein
VKEILLLDFEFSVPSNTAMFHTSEFQADLEEVDQ